MTVSYYFWIYYQRRRFLFLRNQFEWYSGGNSPETELMTAELKASSVLGSGGPWARNVTDYRCFTVQITASVYYRLLHPSKAVPYWPTNAWEERRSGSNGSHRPTRHLSQIQLTSALTAHGPHHGCRSCRSMKCHRERTDQWTQSISFMDATFSTRFFSQIPRQKTRAFFSRPDELLSVLQVVKSKWTVNGGMTRSVPTLKI